VTLLDRSSVNSFLGSAAGTSSLTVYPGSICGVVSLPGVACGVTSVDGFLLTSVDCTGAVSLANGTCGNVGVTTVPSSLTAIGTELTGNAITAAGIEFDGVQSDDPTMVVTSTVAGITSRNSYFSESSTFDSADNIVTSDGILGEPTAVNSIIAQRVTVGGDILCNVLNMADVQANGTTVAAAVMTAVGGSILGSVALSTSGVISGGCEVTGQITMGVGAGSLLVQRSSVHVAVAGASLGAIHTLGPCAVTLVDCYVRADDTLISVSSLGVALIGAGLCRWWLLSG